MKKKLAATTAVLFALTLPACSGNTGTTGNGETGDTSPTTDSQTTAAETSSVVYEVTGDGATANNITYMTMSSGNIGQEQANAAPLPFTKEVTLEDPGMFDMNSFSLTAQADDSGTTISCKITVDGEVVAEQTSTGPYSVVTCSGS